MEIYDIAEIGAVSAGCGCRWGCNLKQAFQRVMAGNSASEG
jgi:hypothetical protein